MHRFLVFAGSYYYPCGGWDDFRGSYATFDEADARCQELVKSEEVDMGRYVYHRSEEDWAQVVDGETGIKVESYNKEAR